MLSTQIGGKYHPDDDSVFQVKRVLVHLGVTVSHPLADEIKASDGDCAFAFDPSAQSFCDVERHYYESIRKSDFHVVCNKFKANLGYLGGSASLEMAYAMCHGRPIVVLYPVAINANIDSQVRSFIVPRLHQLVTHDFLRATSTRNQRVLSNLRGNCVNYGVGKAERYAIESRADALLEELSIKTTDATT